MTLRGLLTVMHVIGMTLWIGGALAAMVAAITAKREPVTIRAGVFRVLGRVHVWVVAPGALLTVASGLLLVVVFMRRGMGAMLGAAPLSIMMGAGLVAGLLVLFIGLPAAQKAAALAVPDEAGNLPPAFHRFRSRLTVVSSVAGVLALIALWFGVVGT